MAYLLLRSYVTLGHRPLTFKFCHVSHVTWSTLKLISNDTISSKLIRSWFMTNVSSDQVLFTLKVSEKLRAVTLRFWRKDRGNICGLWQLVRHSSRPILFSLVAYLKAPTRPTAVQSVLGVGARLVYIRPTALSSLQMKHDYLLKYCKLNFTKIFISFAQSSCWSF